LLTAVVVTGHITAIATRDMAFPGKTVVRSLRPSTGIYNLTRLRQDVLHSQASDPVSSAILSSLKSPNPTPQTLTEKIVQRFAVGLPKDKFVKSGEYITLSSHHCMLMITLSL
jgi:hypothetical protein